MQREIRYKAFHKKYKQFLRISSICFSKKQSGDPEHNIVKEPFYILLDEYGKIFVAPKEEVETVQFSGLYDKNNQPIFEGDIVKTTKGRIGKIVFCEEYCAFVFRLIKSNSSSWDQNANLFYTGLARLLTPRGLMNLNWRDKNPLETDYEDEDLEVIGNIYKNPDLLTN